MVAENTHEGGKEEKLEISFEAALAQLEDVIHQMES